MVQKLREEIIECIQRRDERAFWEKLTGKRRGIGGESGNIKEEVWEEYFKTILKEADGRKGENEDINERDYEKKDQDEKTKSRGLDDKISREEIREAIKSMKKGRAPGVDGLPIEVFKELEGKDDFIEILEGLFNLIFETKAKGIRGIPTITEE